MSGLRVRYRIVAVFSTVGALCCGLGWLGALFGPRPWLYFAVIGFLLGLIGYALPKKADDELDEKTRGHPRRRRLQRLVQLVGLVVLVSMGVLFSVARLDGVADYPAFEKLEEYQLNNHGHLEPVSRLRYITISASFSTGWCGMALLLNLSILYRALYGRDVF